MRGECEIDLDLKIKLPAEDTVDARVHVFTGRGRRVEEGRLQGSAEIYFQNRFWRFESSPKLHSSCGFTGSSANHTIVWFGTGPHKTTAQTHTATAHGFTGRLPPFWVKRRLPGFFRTDWF